MSEQPPAKPPRDWDALHAENNRVHDELDKYPNLFDLLENIAPDDPRFAAMQPRLDRIQKLFETLDASQARDAEQLIAGDGNQTATRKFEDRHCRYLSFRTVVASAQLDLVPQARLILYDYERVKYSAHTTIRPPPDNARDRDQERD